MENFLFNIFLSKGWDGKPFELFETAHVGMLVALALLNLWLLTFRDADETTRKKVRITLAIVLWVNELAWHFWNVYLGTWNIRSMLPLHLCSVMIWLSGFMLIFKNYTIYEFAYFLGIGAGIQAVLTPDVGIYNFPHMRFLQSFIGHGLIITSAIYMTIVETFRPTWKSLFRVIIFTNIYALGVFFINFLIDSNYMMLNQKPPVASLIDLLPDWPYYIIYAEIIGVITCLLLYLPFAITDWRNSKLAKETAA